MTGIADARAALDALARIEVKLASLSETVDGIGKAVDVVGRVQDRQADRIASIDITASRIREEVESISDMLSGRQETTEADDSPAQQTLADLSATLWWLEPEDLIQWATLTADEADITVSGHWDGGAETVLTPGHADRIVREATEARIRSAGRPDEELRGYLCDTSSYLAGGSTASLTDDAGEPEGGDCA